jgi:hypothetical protein
MIRDESGGLQPGQRLQDRPGRVTVLCTLSSSSRRTGGGSGGRV